MPNVPKEKLNKEHLIVLYAVNKATDGVPTKTHYQKMMYLIIKALGNDPKTSAGYAPNHYGPYSYQVEDWRGVLLNAGYLEKNTAERIRIPADVKEDVDKISFKNTFLEQKIDSIVEFVNSLAYNELLLYIYSDDILKGEGMSENSDVKEEILQDRVNIAIGMVRRNKVSVAKGAELADMDVGSFENLVDKRKNR